MSGKTTQGNPTTLTLREASARTGISLHILYEDADKGRLKASREERHIVYTGFSTTREMRVVSVEDLKTYVEERNQRIGSDKKPVTLQRSRKPSSWNPYPDHWRRGTIPEHLRSAAFELWQGVEAEADYRRRQRRKAEVAM